MFVDKTTVIMVVFIDVMVFILLIDDGWLGTKLVNYGSIMMFNDS